MAVPRKADGLRLVSVFSIALALTPGTVFAQSDCHRRDSTSFPKQLRHWLAKWPPNDAPALIRDPAWGLWRIRLGLVVTVPWGQHARVVAPGVIVAASCTASCTLAIDHGSGYVMRYGGLAHAGFQVGTCASALTNLPVKRRSDGMGRISFALFRDGRPVDPRKVARMGINEP